MQAPHNAEQLGTDNPSKPPLDASALLNLSKKLKKETSVVVFWRERDATPGAAKAPYVRQDYLVDAPRRTVIVDSANDEHVWLSPKDRPDDAEPFPEDGRNENDHYEYSYVDVSGEPDAEPPVTKKATRTRPSSKARSETTDDGGSGMTTVKTGKTLSTGSSVSIQRAGTRLIQPPGERFLTRGTHR